MNAPLHNGNPRHALAAPRFAVRAPNKTVTKARARAVSPTREGGALGRLVFPGLAPGASGARFATTSSVASKSIAVPRCRMTVQGGRCSLTVTAPSRTWAIRSPSATYAPAPGRWTAAPQPPGVRRERPRQDAHGGCGEPVPVFDQRRQVEGREQPAVAQRPML